MSARQQAHAPLLIDWLFQNIMTESVFRQGVPHTFDASYIDGRWTPASGVGAIDILDASIEKVIAHLTPATAADVDAAVRSASAAFKNWAGTSGAQRRGYLQSIAEGLKQRAGELAEAISMEVGMPLKLSNRIQVQGPIAAWERYAELAESFAFEEQVGHSLVVREPVGVVACITPWNYPLHQVTCKVAAALAAGCTVVLKPSEVAPITAYLLAQVIHDAGLPAGVFNLVAGSGPEIGEALVVHSGVDMVSLTGSTRAGKRVAELAARDVKRVALELGGKSASVILEDADLATAVRATVSSCFLNSGQTCSALTRMLVPEARYDEAKAIAREVAAGFRLGDPFDSASKLGPLVSAAQREQVRGFIRTALAQGAELIAGGPDAPEGLGAGYFVKPTIFGRVHPDSQLGQEEVFGPVLAILTYRDENEAIRIANGTVYGLAGAVWSGDQARALRVARQLRAGQVDINGAAFNPVAPFGGFKQSGIGRENGPYGVEEFLELKALQLKS